MDLAPLIALVANRIIPHRNYVTKRIVFWGIICLLFLSGYIFALVGACKYLHLFYDGIYAYLYMGGILFSSAIFLLVIYYLKSKLIPQTKSLRDTLINEIKPLEKYVEATTHFLKNTGKLSLNKRPLLTSLLLIGVGFISEKLIERNKEKL